MTPALIFITAIFFAGGMFYAIASAVSGRPSTKPGFVMKPSLKVSIALSLSLGVLFVLSGPAEDWQLSTVVWIGNNYLSEINYGILATISFEPFDPRIDIDPQLPTSTQLPDQREWREWREIRSARYKLALFILPYAAIGFFTWTILKFWSIFQYHQPKEETPLERFLAIIKNIGYVAVLLIFAASYYNSVKHNIGRLVDRELSNSISHFYRHLENDEIVRLQRRVLFLSNMGEYKSLLIDLDALAAEHGVTLPPRQFALR